MRGAAGSAALREPALIALAIFATLGCACAEDDPEDAGNASRPVGDPSVATGDGGPERAAFAAIGPLRSGPAVLDPDAIALMLGGLGGTCPTALATTDDPDHAWLEVDCYAFDPRVRPSDGAMLYRESFELRQFVPDGNLQTRGTELANDPVLARCAAGTGYSSLHYWIAPDTSDVVYGCLREQPDCFLSNCEDYFDGGGVPFTIAPGYNIAALGHAGHVLLWGGCDAAALGYAVQDASGAVTPVAYDPRAYPAILTPANTTAFRAREDGFWALVSWPYSEVSRWHIAFDGTLTFEGFYRRKELQYSLWTGPRCALDAEGRAYCHDSDRIYRMTLGADGYDVIYEPDDSRTTSLLPDSLFTGP